MANLAARALTFATNAHAGQFRKYTGEPYIRHPMNVADIAVRGYPHASLQTLDVVRATAYLHDVVEDCGVKLDEIEEKFGKRVAMNVFYLTDVSRKEDGNRAYRKKLDRWHIAYAPQMAKTVKLADLLDNSWSIVTHDPDFANIYLREKSELLKTMRGGSYRLRTECYSVLKNYKHVWQKDGP